MPFRSKRQQAKFFADPALRKYAKRWAHETGEGGGTRAGKRAYARLPERARPGKKRPARRRRGRS